MAKKDFGKRLVPEYLLKYSEDLFKNHPDPSASWGGGSEGGGDYTAGYGIKIDNKDISIDQDVVALKSALNGYIQNNDTSYSAIFRGKEAVIKNEGEYNSTSYQDGSIHRNIPRTAGYTYTFPDKDGTFAMKSDIITSYNDLTDKPTIPTKTSDLQNDSGFITSVLWDDVVNKPTFATVATSGSYNDLTDKPYIIPSNRVVTTDEIQTISGVKTFEGNIKIKEVTGAQTTSILPDTFDYTQINPATREKSRTKFKLPTSKPKGTEDAPTEYTLATTDDIPNVPSTDNLVTLDTAQTITGLKTIGQTSGTISEVDFSGFTFKLSNKAINHPEADIKIRNGSYDGYQHPIISSSKGLYVNLAKIRLGDDGNNTYGITMPDSSTWDSDRVLATTADIPAVPTVNDSTITFTQGGVTKGSFSLNQATNQTIELDAGGAQAPAFEITNMVVDSSAQTITLTITQNN